MTALSQPENRVRPTSNELTEATNIITNLGGCNQLEVAAEYLAYFKKYQLVWTKVPNKQSSRDLIQQLDHVSATLARLVEFLDSAPWLTTIGTYAERWEALKYLREKGLIVAKIRWDLREGSSTRSPEGIEVWEIARRNATVFLGSGHDAYLPTEQDFNNLLESRRRLIQDLGPGAIGGKSMIEQLSNLTNAVLRQAIYSGLTVVNDEFLDVIETQNIKVKLLILTTAPASPYDEGTDADSLRNNLYYGIHSVREGIFGSAFHADKRPSLNIWRPEVRASWGIYRSAKQKKKNLLRLLDIRFHGDTYARGLFRGYIISTMRGHRESTSLAQFAVWRPHDERAVHGELGVTEGDTNLAHLLVGHFDWVFDRSVPMFKRQFVSLLWRSWSEQTRATFVVMTVGALVLLALNVLLSAGLISELWSVQVGQIWGWLVGMVTAATVPVVVGIGKFMRPRGKNAVDYKKYFPRLMAKHVEEVRKQREDVNQGQYKMKV